MYKLNRAINILCLLMLLAGIYACAKIGSPYGGPKDEDPPKLIRARPPENTVNFIPQKKIILVFDEYIQLKNILQELIISPPLKESISAHIKGKSVVIDFPAGAVFDSTTYTISFGNAIADHNEGNVLENYQYVFSLNDYIDSMNVEGTIVSAFNLQPDKDRMLVMLYENLEDSIPLLEKPSYAAWADKGGKFAINRIETGKYRIFGLKDANLNMLYDLPNENIAFGDSIIELTPEKFRDDLIIQDSFLYDSLVNIHAGGPDLSTDTSLYEDEMQEAAVPDSLVSDSLSAPVQYIYRTELFFFAKDIYNQYLTDYQRPRRELLRFIFNEPLLDTFELFPLNHVPAQDDWVLIDASEDLDTLNAWITDTSMFAMDSLKMELCYPMTDSSGSLYNRPDTLLMIFQDKKAGSDKGSKDASKSVKEDLKEDKHAGMSIVNNITKANAFDLNRELVLISESPLESFVGDSLKLFRIQDTLEFPVRHNVFRDPNSIYRVIIDYEPEESTSYRFFARDSVIRDIYGNVNDTLEYKFKTQALNAYSTMTVDLKNVKGPLILQVLNNKEEVKLERFPVSDSKERFEYMMPGNYILKIIIDGNENRKWDSGDYLNKIQPEKVLYFDQTIELRANWEIEYSWDLNQ